MKAFQLATHAIGVWFGLICILAIMQQHNVNALYTMNETCNYLSFGYIGDPNDCKAWGYCRAGSLIQTGRCDNGYLYDSENGMCNYANSVNCHTTAQNICANTVAPEFVGDPNNCNRYCYCANNNIVQCNFCPANQVFDPDQTECVWSKLYTCPANSICRLVQNSVFVGDPNKCGNFIRCVGGTGQSRSCTGAGLPFFNPMTAQCEAVSQCTNSPNAPNPTNVTPAPTVCTGTPAKSYFPVPASCANYWACPTTAQDAITYGTCPFAMHFDNTLQKCVSPVGVKCTADRCANLNLPLVAVPGNQCQSYQVCSNQKSVPGEIFSCADAYPNTNYKYFDETIQACVTVPPKYAVCQGT